MQIFCQINLGPQILQQEPTDVKVPSPAMGIILPVLQATVMGSRQNAKAFSEGTIEGVKPVSTWGGSQHCGESSSRFLLLRIFDSEQKPCVISLTTKGRGLGLPSQLEAQGKFKEMAQTQRGSPSVQTGVNLNYTERSSLQYKELKFSGQIA